MFERVSRTSWGATQVGSLLYSNPAEETVAFQRETESHPRLNLSSTEAPQFTMKNSSPPSPHVLHLSGLILQPPRQITPDIITALVNYCSETSGTITRVQLCHGNYAGWHRCLEDQRTCKLSRRNCRWKRSKEPYLIPFVQLRELIHLGLVRTNTERCLHPTGKA